MPTAATRVIGLARPQIDAYRQRYGTPAERIVIAPPTMARERRQPERRSMELRADVRGELGIPEDAPCWLWLGLQPAVKGLDRVIKALSHSPRSHLLVGGLTEDDPKARTLVALAKKMGVADRIEWLGYISGDKFFAAIAAADALAHPARLDVTGGVILEALVNGLPVATTDNCGFAEHVIRSGAGKVVRGDPFDADAFEGALADICGPGNVGYSANGVRYGTVRNLYSGTSIACDLIEADAWTGPLARYALD